MFSFIVGVMLGLSFFALSVWCMKTYIERCEKKAKELF